jgi:hypothetical protein
MCAHEALPFDPQSVLASPAQGHMLCTNHGSLTTDEQDLK